MENGGQPLSYFKLPEDIIDAIKKQFAVTEANFAKGYGEDLSSQQLAPEDGYTGQFSSNLKDNVNGSAGGFTWKIRRQQFTPHKEKLIGADVAFEVEVKDVREGKLQVRTKTVLIQCKHSKDKDRERMVRQAQDMLKTGRDSRFGVFSEKGIDIFDAKSVEKADGRLSGLKEKAESLSSFFGDKVLRCKAGTPETKLDDFKKYKLGGTGSLILALNLKPKYIVTLQIHCTNKEKERE